MMITGRREILRNATTVIDEYQCKIECALMDDCLAYFYQVFDSLLKMCTSLDERLKIVSYSYVVYFKQCHSRIFEVLNGLLNMTHQAKGTQCVLLGSHQTKPICLPPANESLKILDDTLCPIDNTTNLYNSKPNPSINNSYAKTPANTNAPRPCNNGLFVRDI